MRISTHIEVYEPSEDDYRLLIANSMSSVFVSFQPPYLCPPEGHKHGVSIHSLMNLSKTFLRISPAQKIAQTWIFARLFECSSSFISLILDFICWMVLMMVWRWKSSIEILRGCPCKNRPLDFRPKTEVFQIFRVRQLVHMIKKNGNNLAFNAIFQYFWRQFQRTVQNRLNRSVSSQISALRWRRWKIILSLKYNKANRSFYFMFCLLIKGKIFEIELNKY